MATTALPGLRKVAAELLTPLGWMSGTLHVPSHLPLEEHLAFGRQDLKLTAVTVPDEPDRLRFLALRREMVLVLAPAVADDVPAASPFSAPRQVACLLPSGILRGTLEVFMNLRLSDQLHQQGPTVTLRRCLLTPYGATANSAGARSLHTAVLNLSRVIGIAEDG